MRRGWWIAVVVGCLALGIAPVAAQAYWKPKATTDPWQIQLQGKVDPTVDAPVFDFDGLDNTGKVVRKVQRGGGKAICYVSAGSYEPFRADAARFPPEVLGAPIQGFEEERWLDIRRIDLLGPILRARFAECKRKGFDAIDPDNVDGYTNQTGFPLTAADQLRFNRWLADEVHSIDLAIGLKNDLEQIPELVESFDFAINEQCFEFNECARLKPFIRADKPVFGIEYDVPLKKFCKPSIRLGFSTIFKTLALKAPRKTC